MEKSPKLTPYLMEAKIVSMCPQCGRGFKHWRSAARKYCSKSCAGRNNTTHGMSGTSVHRSWKAMKHRCYNKNDSQYSDYGGRGITVCDRWRNSFENFYEDMGKKPKGYTLERIDNSGMYQPDNCRWATYTEQANNTRRTNFIIKDGRRITLMEIARATKIHPETLRARIKKGWAYDRIVLVAQPRERDAYGRFI